MIEGTITFTGRTYDDVWHALVEAYSRIEDGMTSGHDRNEDGSFTFDLTVSTGRKAGSAPGATGPTKSE